MAGITQTIPNFNGGISQQPDDRKFPGQVKDIVNAIPDVVQGLYKRPGSKRIDTSLITDGDRSHSTASGKLKDVQSGGSWFHYHRDETEGNYIGQIASDGTVRVWRCSDGLLMDTAWGTGGVTALKAYLASNTPEDIQALTISDTTFFCNRSKTVNTTGTTSTLPDSGDYAYVDLLRTENGRQYAMNIYANDGTTTNITTATRIKIDSDTLVEADGTGECPGIGTQVFHGMGNSNDPTNTDNLAGHQRNLNFRITTTGQQALSKNYKPTESSYNGGDSDNKQTHPDGDNYVCSYNKQVELLFGGEGWSVDSTRAVTMDVANGGGGSASNAQSQSAIYTVKVTDAETVAHKCLDSSKQPHEGSGCIRPAPTPFGTDTAVSADAVLGGIITELNNVAGIEARVVGTGIYIKRTNGNINVEILDNDLMRVMTTSINDVAKLPLACTHGYMVEVKNTKNSDEDNYWVKFEGDNDQDGPGAWVECAAPGIPLGFDKATMPVVIQRTSSTEFTVKQWDWAERKVGDETTNPVPSFVTNKINKVLFFRNRLALLSKENVILSKAGTIATPDFWAETALTVSAIDPIDISCSSLFPSDLFDAIETNAGLLCFSTNQQFLLSSDDTILNPDTAKLRPVSSYNYNKTIPPISLGITVGFVDNSNKYSKFNEIVNVSREAEPVISDTTVAVPTLLEKNIDLFTNSRENRLVMFGKSYVNDTTTPNADIVYGFKYINGEGGAREQAAWFKWKMNQPLLYHFIVNDEYYFLDKDHFLQKINIIQADSDNNVITIDNEEYLTHLDNWTTISGGTFSATNNVTTFNNVDWLNQIVTPNGDLVLLDIGKDTLAGTVDTARVGSYAKCTSTGATSFTVPGDWSSRTVTAGYLYEYSIELPRFYRKQVQGKAMKTDVNASLIVHRLKLNLGKIGLYETTLSRVGKDAYTDLYESSPADEYTTNESPYLTEEIKTIPVYEKNVNVGVTVKSSHPGPATLRSLSWEGDYSPMNYRRV